MHRKKAAAQRAPKRPLSLLFSLVPSFFPCLFPFVILPTDAPTKKKRERPPTFLSRRLSLSLDFLSASTSPSFVFFFFGGLVETLQKILIGSSLCPFFLPPPFSFFFSLSLYESARRLLFFFLVGPWSSPTFFFFRLGLWPCSPISLCRRRRCCCGIHLLIPFRKSSLVRPCRSPKNLPPLSKKRKEKAKKREKATLCACCVGPRRRTAQERRQNGP